MTNPDRPSLAEVAASHSIDPGEVIDPVKLAVRLIEAGESVQTAAALCGVNRTQLYRKIKPAKS